MQELKIDPEFRDKIPPLSNEEYRRLEENIVADGEVREPIIVWNGTIVDGHHRWQIIQRHPEIPYKVKEMDFADKWAAISWMCSNQLGRRNIIDEQKTYLLGKLYEARKNTQGNHAARGEDGRYLSAQNEHIGKPRISDQIAKEQGVARETVKRAEHFAKGLDAADVVPGFKDEILSGKVKAKKADIMELRNLKGNDLKEAVDAIRNPRPKKEPESFELTDRIVKEFRDTTREVVYTIDDFAQEYKYLVTDFINSTNTMLTVRKDVVAESKDEVMRLLDSAIDQIKKIKEAIK